VTAQAVPTISCSNRQAQAEDLTLILIEIELFSPVNVARSSMQCALSFPRDQPPECVRYRASVNEPARRDRFRSMLRSGA
jgi:hypothetical protein